MDYLLYALAAIAIGIEINRYRTTGTYDWKRVIVTVAIALAVSIVINLFIANDKKIPDAKNATYLIQGKSVTLVNGIAEEILEDSTSKVVTRYFGNELKTDLDADGREDVAFILTQEAGGSGTFYYAVAALNTESGYVGSDGYLLGDRIAPQSTNVSQNPRHKNVVVFNYATRNPDEPMTASPSVGKSVYLKIDPPTVRWGIVVPDFEGESR